MQTEKLIPLHHFCMHYNIETSFINELQNFGLIDIITVEETTFIDADQVNELEKFVRLHRELDINFEGLDAITHLLQKVQEMQQEIIALKNKLRLYEDPG